MQEKGRGNNLKEKAEKHETNNQKKPKVNKKTKLISLFILLLLIIAGGYIAYTKYYIPETTKYTASLFKENNVLIEELTFKEGSYINLLNDKGEVDKTIKLKNNNETIKLQEDPEEIIDTWEIEEKINKKDKFYQRDILYFELTPKYRDKKDLILTFKADDDKANILENEQVADYIKVGYKKDTPITDYFADLEIDKDFKGDWYIDNDKVNNETKIDKATDLVFKTYQDKNNNNIDDFTETFTIKFETNLEQEIPEKVVKWEETINLPELKDDTKVFFEWYSDKEYKNKITENDKITSDMTLFAKIIPFEEVVNKSVSNPIDRKDIALQVKRMLDKRNSKVDEVYNKEIEEKEKEREALINYNKENNIIMQDLETTIDLHNLDHNKLHLITFTTPLNDFIYSIIAPYGQTIKITNEYGELYKEYAVRHDTTITLDEDKLIQGGNELEEYHSEYRKINNTIFIKIQPITK